MVGYVFAESVGVGGAGGDALCATLYAGGCGGLAQFRCFEISIVAVFSQSARDRPARHCGIKYVIAQLLQSTSYPGKCPRCNV